MSTAHEQLDVLETYQFDMEHRKEAFSISKRSDYDREEFEDMRGQERNRSSTLFSRTSIELVNFEDFRIIKIIGRGTFGKVTIPVMVNSMYIGVPGREHEDRKKICYEEHQKRYCYRARFCGKLTYRKNHSLASGPPIYHQHAVCLLKVLQSLFRHGLHPVSIILQSML